MLHLDQKMFLKFNILLGLIVAPMAIIAGLTIPVPNLAFGGFLLIAGGALSWWVQRIDKKLDRKE